MLDTRAPLDLGGGLGGRAGRAVAERVLQRPAELVQLALGPFPAGPLEPLDAALRKRSQVAAEGVLEDAGQTADVLVWQAMASGVDGLGLQVHAGVGIMEALMVPGVDPFGDEVDYFVEKVRDIVGLYLSPPERALLLCVDEKSQVQALDRTQPLLPMTAGTGERPTHDYVRNGTTSLFAALNVATGEVIGQCHRRHRHQEFLNFLNELDTK